MICPLCIQIHSTSNESLIYLRYLKFDNLTDTRSKHLVKFVADVGMLRKKIKLSLQSWNNFKTVQSQLFE